MSDLIPPESPSASSYYDDGDVDTPSKTKKRICKVTAAANASKSGRKVSAIAQEKKLRALLSDSADIQSVDHFTYWKDEFLDSYRDYIDKERAATAREADDELNIELQNFAQTCLKVKEFCATGGISVDNSSVKGQNALSEFVAAMAKLEQKIKDYFPKTKQEEEEVGYSKFELAAVLIRDGFRVYDVMITTRDYVVALRDGPLGEGDILKNNSKSIMGFYLKGIDSFCDCMADMGMRTLMDKCLEMYKIRPRKKKKKVFQKGAMDALSDSETGEDANKGRMFRRPKNKTRAIIDHGWTSGTLGSQVLAPEGAPLAVEGEIVDSLDMDDKLGNDKPTDFIYYYDADKKTLGKVRRDDCKKQGVFLKKSKKTSSKEEFDGAVEDWEGTEGKSELIWMFKEALKGRHYEPGNGMTMGTK